MTVLQQWQYQAAGGITSVALSPDGRQIVAGSLAKMVYCLDDTGSKLWQAPVPNQAWRIDLSADGETAVVGSGSTRFWDMRGRGLFCFNRDGSLRWEQHLSASVWGLSLAADGKTVAVGSSNKQLLVFDGQGNKLWELDVAGIGWYAWVWSTAVSADGSLIAAGAADKRLRLSDRSGRLLTEFQARGDLFAVGISADGTAVAAGDTKGYLYLLDQHGRLLWEEQLSDTIWRVQPTADGSRLLVGAGEKERHIRVYDRDGRLRLRRFVEGSVGCLDMSADGQRIAIGTRKGGLYIFDEAGEVLHTAQRKANIRDVALSHSGDMVIAGSEDGYIYGFRLSPPATAQNIVPEPQGTGKRQEKMAKITTAPHALKRPNLPTFGAQLRYYRREAKDQEQGGPLTQSKLANLLSREGHVYSDAMISHWERDKIQISHTDRQLLLALIRIFQQHGVIQDQAEANNFLITGKYSPLDEKESNQLFSDDQGS